MFEMMGELRQHPPTASGHVHAFIVDVKTTKSKKKGVLNVWPG